MANLSFLIYVLAIQVLSGVVTSSELGWTHVRDASETRLQCTKLHKGPPHLLPHYDSKYRTLAECQNACLNLVENCDAVNYDSEKGGKCGFEQCNGNIRHGGLKGADSYVYGRFETTAVITAARPKIVTRPSPTKPSLTRSIACERENCRTPRPCERRGCSNTEPPCQNRECLRFSTQRPCEREECRGTEPPCEDRECLRFTSRPSCTREDCRGTEAPCQERECQRYSTHPQAPCEREACRTEPPCTREACRSPVPCQSRECLRPTTQPPCVRDICPNQVQCHRQECPRSVPCYGLNCQHWKPDPNCQDTANWSDSKGRTCTDYAAVCMMNGGWQELLKVHSVPNVFEAHRNTDSGLSAVDACCMCGKGTKEALANIFGHGKIGGGTVVVKGRKLRGS